MPKEKKITLTDIANFLNLSVTTVYRALNNEGRISKGTKEEVIKAAQKMGYKPNVFAKALSSKDEVKIAVVCPLDLYFRDVVEGINTYYEELPPYNIKIFFKHCDVYDIGRQLEQIDECIEEKMDGVMIAAAHPMLLNNSIDKLIDMKIATITFVDDAPESKRMCYIGQNAALVGQMAGELMSRFVKQSGRVAIMTTLSACQGDKDRTNNFIKFIKNYRKDISITGPFEYYDNGKSSEQIAREIIKNGNVDGIYANNMVGTRGLGFASKELGITDEIVLIGHDSNEEIDKYIEEGIIDATLFQDPFSQGYYSLKVLFEHIYLEKDIHEKIYYTTSYFLMKSNIMQKRGWNEVYYSKPGVG